MQMALDASRNALPACRPNPPVGCVLVDGENQVLAIGHTHAPGGWHAEAHALAQLEAKGQHDRAQVRAYVTLEPCAFYGRTPACAQALVKSGIRRVFVAILDPDPRNSGNGVAILREGGIEVTVGVLAQGVRSFLTPYLGCS